MSRAFIHKQKSFTLIELLVVIAIIGLLSSIVLVSVSQVREKARIAAGLQFASNLDHSLMPVGVWKLDGDAKDSSGNGNDGILVNMDASNYVEGIQGQALSFNGSDEHVKIPDDDSLDVSKITIAAWVKPDDFGEHNAIVQKWYYAGDTMRQYLFSFLSQASYGGRLRLYLSSTGGNSPRWDTPDGVVSAGVWSHVAATWDGSMVKIYVNGVSQTLSGTSTGAWAGPLNTNGANDVWIGRYYTGTGWRFDGLIDEVRIYEEALTSAQIQKLYAQGLERHQKLTKGGN